MAVSKRKMTMEVPVHSCDMPGCGVEDLPDARKEMFAFDVYMPKEDFPPSPDGLPLKFHACIDCVRGFVKFGPKKKYAVQAGPAPKAVKEKKAS